MFSSEGEVVGVVISSRAEGENLNFAVPINYVRGMWATASEETIKTWDLPLETETEELPLETARPLSFPVELPIGHRHLFSTGDGRLTLGDSTIRFQEGEGSGHDFAVPLEDVTQLNQTNRRNALTLHFGVQTGAGTRITFFLGEMDRALLVDFVRTYCVNAVVFPS